MTYTTVSAFHALELPDADELLVKAELVRQISHIVEDRGLEEGDLAELVGLDEQAASALLHGRLGQFSVEQLLRALTGLGQDVRIEVRPAEPGEARGRITVDDRLAA